MTKSVRGVNDGIASRLDEVRRLVASHDKVSDVIAWFATLGRKEALPDLVTQDEFTHDITISLDDCIHLVYDAT